MSRRRRAECMLMLNWYVVLGWRSAWYDQVSSFDPLFFMLARRAATRRSSLAMV
jgi:hypothetical protein